MSGVLERGFQVVERLAAHPEGCQLSALASELAIPLSATHRLLTELTRLGYVRQTAGDGQYVLTIKLAAMGLSYLSNSGIVDIAQPLLDEMAAKAGDLVRLAVVDGEDLIFVAKAQGATRGLRYDPDMGLSVPLSCSAAGHAWLSCMTDDEALSMLARKGLASAQDHGPNAPRTIKDAMKFVKQARQRGYSMISDMFSPGMSAMAAPIRDASGVAIGVVTVAGPLVRLTPERMEQLSPHLLQTADLVARASSASQLFRKAA
ncbi:IclR family transcriptional regulator [Acidovorax sacchari]|uniref:IclR family transcriptional regulator n=1 Tax=Acidovorax sacchari TaxID=3230736 RepID=UPI0039E37CC6